MTDCQGTPEKEDLAEATRMLPITSEVDMRIDRNGIWYHEGREIERKALARLFSTVLQREEAGTYWLVTPVERAQIVVEDVPFTVVELKNTGRGPDQVISFRNNMDQWVNLDNEHPIRIDFKDVSDEPSPYILIRKGLEARIVRSAFYQLMDLAEEKDNKAGIWSSGMFHVLGDVE
ncbi:proteophosphoglycan precursor [Kiloniella spongiae]|uniref:Proteophosphoglycan n=1 Tax=Kiloniella spongiae TaxID=1489064 RepID=A0A0H2MN92_9PROT|nr:DUF1285 domain-containing protein [Kiloniella spongiae]KLN62257.1 proteophosphoglycan precursor [Kiloniella spongiae]